jgi:hypothetical protein
MEMRLKAARRVDIIAFIERMLELWLSIEPPGESG